MSTQTVYQLDANGYYVGETEADESPREPGRFLIPGGCVEAPPPQAVQGKVRRWANDGWVYEDLPSIPDEPTPIPQTFDEALAAKLKQINDRCIIELRWVKAGYPDDEVQSWPKQEQEARAYAADNTAVTPFLTALAAARQVPLDILVAKVIEKADLFALATGTIIGKRQRCEDLLDALDEANGATIADISAVEWPQ